MKKIIVLILSGIIALSPLFNIGDFSYADEQPSWVYVTQQDDEPQRAVVVGAIKAYLGTRSYNNTFTYKAEQAIVQWSYNNWDKFAKSKGYNGLSDLNNHIAYRYNNNGVLEFFLDNSSIEIMNQIYTAILEYYDIEENETKEIYNGKWFQDDDDNGAYVYQITQTFNEQPSSVFNTYVQKIGTPYRFNYDEILNIFNSLESGQYNSYDIYVNSAKLCTWYLYKYDGSDYKGLNLNPSNQITNNNRPSSVEWSYNDKNIKTFQTIVGYPIIVEHNSNLYLGNYRESYLSDSENNYTIRYATGNVLNNNEAKNQAISAAQAGLNAGIVAAGKSAAITTGKEGLNALKDYIEDDDSTDDDVVTPVDDPIPPDDIPTGGSPSGYNDTGGVLTPDGNGGFNFNFKMPQLNINWNLELNTNNLPFPFSIPSDFYKAFQAIDVEPEPPSFSKVIHLGFGNKWSYNWNFECDFSEIDGAESLANIHRKWFLFVYIVMLIIATRAVMHIY